MIERKKKKRAYRGLSIAQKSHEACSADKKWKADSRETYDERALTKEKEIITDLLYES